MKEIFEAALGMFFMVMMTVVSMTCIATSIDAKNADATKTAYIAQIEDSNFSSQVLQDIFNESLTDGKYTVKMTLYHKAYDSIPGSSNMTTFATDASSVGNTSDVYMVRLELSFDYAFKYWNDVVTHNLMGYAR